MKEYLTDDEIEYTCEVHSDGIIELAIRGNINAKTILELSTWSEQVKKTIRRMYNRNPKRVLTIMDCSDVGRVTVHCSGALHDLLRHNKQYVTRTAIFGANKFSMSVIEMAIHITRRNNIQLFDSKEKALSWLSEIDNRK